MRNLIFSIVAACALGACASTSTLQQPAPQTPAAQPVPDHIEQAEVRHAVDAYDAVAMLRPEWLVQAQDTAHVGIFVNGRALHLATDLRIVPASAINRIELLTAPRLQQVIGDSAGALLQAAIVVSAGEIAEAPAATGTPAWWFRLGARVYPHAFTRGVEPESPVLWFAGLRMGAHAGFLELMIGDEIDSHLERFTTSVGQRDIDARTHVAAVIGGVEVKGFRAGLGTARMKTNFRDSQLLAQDKQRRQWTRLVEVGVSRNVWKAITVDAAVQQHWYHDIAVGTGLNRRVHRQVFAIGLGLQLQGKNSVNREAR